LFQNDGSGAFTDQTSGPLGNAGNGTGVAWGDYDNDGDLDLYVANDGANKLFRNDGSGTFSDVTGPPLDDTGSGTGVAWGDYDNDGDLDLYVANAGSANKLFRNDQITGNHWLHVDLVGVLSNTSGIGARVRVVAGGISQIREVSGGSGYLSQNSLTAEFGLGLASTVDTLEITWPSGLIRRGTNVPVDQIITLTEGELFWADATSGPLGDAGNGEGVAWGDYDNDGDLDLYLANTDSANKLFRNDGGAGFTDATSDTLGDTGTSYGVAWGDYDNDGDLDLYLANMTPSGSNKLFRNDQTTGNHWLHVDLVGVVSNRSGIGARVRVVAGGASQIREVSGGSGYLSQNSLTAEFGLGSATVVDTVEITWPSGITEDSVSVAVDQRIIVLEGWGIVSGTDEPVTPTRFVLHQNVPNPFNPTTMIRFDVPAGSGIVTLRIYDVAGRLVRTLANGNQTPGEKRAIWDGTNEHGEGVASGVYFYRLTAPGFEMTRKMVFLK